METWKNIKGFEGLYEVSNLGRIRSIERVVNYYNPKFGRDSGHLVKGKIKKPSVKENGYLQIALYENNKARNYYIHRLVAQAFIDNPLNKLTVNHIDCDVANNNVNNLEWATQKEQEQHKELMGRKVDCHVKKVTVKYLDGTSTCHKSIVQCAKDIKIHRDTIYNIINGHKSKCKDKFNIEAIEYIKD